MIFLFFITIHLSLRNIAVSLCVLEGTESDTLYLLNSKLVLSIRLIVG